MSCWWYGTLTHHGTRNMKITVASACWEPTVGLIAFTARSGGPRIPSADRWGWHATRPRQAGTTRRDPCPRRAHAYVQLASCARARGGSGSGWQARSGSSDGDGMSACCRRVGSGAERRGPPPAPAGPAVLARTPRSHGRSRAARRAWSVGRTGRSMGCARLVRLRRLVTRARPYVRACCNATACP